MDVHGRGARSLRLIRKGREKGFDAFCLFDYGRLSVSGRKTPACFHNRFEVRWDIGDTGELCGHTDCGGGKDANLHWLGHDASLSGKDI